MTTFTRTWDASYEASPADSQNASQGATRIREIKNDVSERLEVDHSWAGDTDDGAHLKVTFVDPLAVKPVQANDETYIYTKDVSGTSELFFEDEAGNEIQLSAALVSTNNLSDVANASTSRTNLGLGALAVLNLVASAQIATDSVGDDELKTTIGSSGTQSISTSGTWTPVVGFYNISRYSGTGTPLLDLFAGGSWRSSNITFGGGFVWFDGTNMRIRESGSSSLILAWQKLG